MFHSPCGHYGARLALPIASLPRSLVPLESRVRVALSVLTRNQTGGYNIDTPPRVHSLYTREKAQLKGLAGFVEHHGISNKFEGWMKRKGIQPTKVLTSDIKRDFTPLEVCELITDTGIKKTIGIDFTEEEKEMIKKMRW